MAFEHYIRSGKELLRCGYTTGTCAALAAAGATVFLLTGQWPATMTLLTPKGLSVEAPLLDRGGDAQTARCAVRKDAGDDPDVTDGVLIYAQARLIEQGIVIDGGAGVGRVTKPGLDQPVGEAAINSVPRRMIAAAVAQVCAEAGYPGGVEIIISVPEGEERARRTFNPQLGIEGGISILGTSGIVEPMSEQALVDTIAVEAHQAAALDRSGLILTPGNYGLDFLGQMSDGVRRRPRVKYANYLGEAIDIAVHEGFAKVLVVGHLGKLVKLAGGVMNTHSQAADCRREIITAHAAVCGAEQKTCAALMEAVTTDDCIALLERAGCKEAVLARLWQAMQFHLDRRACGELKIGAVVFSNVYGLLGATETAKTILKEWEDK